MYVSTQSKKLGMGEWSEDKTVSNVAAWNHWNGIDQEWNGRGPSRVQYSFIYTGTGTLHHGESKPLFSAPGKLAVPISYLISFWDSTLTLSTFHSQTTDSREPL